MAKATFTLDEDTLRTLRKLAQRSKKPQSMVVREAVAHYAEREQNLAPEERERLLRVLDEMAARPAQPDDKTADDVDRELRELRLARRGGGRLHPND